MALSTAYRTMQGGGIAHAFHHVVLFIKYAYVIHVLNMSMSIGWKLVSIMSLAAALAGAILPGLPTVPFLLLAAWSGGRGWPELEQWLLEHPRHGPAIHRWRERRAVPRKAKVSALAMMVVSLTVFWLSLGDILLTALLAALMAAVALWLWSRPDA